MGTTTRTISDHSNRSTQFTITVLYTYNIFVLPIMFLIVMMLFFFLSINDILDNDIVIYKSNNLLFLYIFRVDRITQLAIYYTDARGAS